MNDKEDCTTKQHLHYESEIVKVVKLIYDPEIPENIYDLGLIYEINVDEDNNVLIDMTLTAPACPVADTLPLEIEDRVREIEGIKSVKVTVVFDPPWDKNRMSEEALLQLGLM